MKAKNLGYRSAAVVLMLAIALSAIPAAKGAIGGGPGEVITPYVPDRPITLNDINRVKKASSEMRTVEDLKLRGTYVTLYGKEVGFMYVVDQDVQAEPSFRFEGVDESGRRDPITIDLSVVRSFSVLRVDKPWFGRDRALLEIVKFPTISPEELLQRPRPSYSDLERHYAETIRLWVTLEDERNGELCLVGKKLYNGRQRQVLARLRDIEPHSEVILGYGEYEVGGSLYPVPIIWWATHSVIEDERYPYRMYFKR